MTGYEPSTQSVFSADAVSLGITRQHGGDIKVKSEEGKGTTFSVFLPVAKVPAEMADEE